MPWITVNLPHRRFPFEFETMIEAGKWLTDFGNLNQNIEKISDMEWGELETDNYVRVLLSEAYHLRECWGDVYFPTKTMNWVRQMERHLKMTPSPALNNGYVAKAGIASWKKKLISAARRADKKK